MSRDRKTRNHAENQSTDPEPGASGVRLKCRFTKSLPGSRLPYRQELTRRFLNGPRFLRNELYRLPVRRNYQHGQKARYGIRYTPPSEILGTPDVPVGQ